MFTSKPLRRGRRPAATGILFFAMFVTAVATAETESQDPGGFSLRLEAMILAPPEEVYSAIVDKIALWWHPTHTFSGNSSNLYIEDRAQGCFCERLNNGGSVRHMEVVFAAPGKLLRMEGGLGPLQSLGVNGSLSWHLHPQEGGTRLEIRYNVGGYLSDGLDAWAKPVDSVLEEQLGRLKNLIETGMPELADGNKEDAG